MDRIKKALTITLICLLGGVIMFGLFGCKEKAKKYKVDYDGEKSWYENAKDEYAAGEEVVMYYCLLATDTDYAFYLDGEKLNCLYDDEKGGFAIRFTMPEHDVRLKCESKNSMVYVPPTEEQDEMLIDSYSGTVGTDGGDGYDEITVYRCGDNQVKLVVNHSSEGGEDTETKYLVPDKVVEECNAVIKKYKMKEWNDSDAEDCLDGVMLVCKFKDGDDYVRVTSEKMPSDGAKAFSEIQAVLNGYVKEEYRLEE